MKKPTMYGVLTAASSLVTVVAVGCVFAIFLYVAFSVHCVSQNGTINNTAWNKMECIK